MLRITKLTDYATVVLCALADAPGRVHSAAELAETARLELPTVSKVLKPLAHAGLVTGFRGASGGYKLARTPAQISLIEIVEAIEGKLGLTECSGEHSNCEHEPHCGTRGHWHKVNEVIAGALRGVSLAEMLSPEGRKAARRIPLQLEAAP
jgi:FeS assembly SUF system regulator